MVQMAGLGHIGHTLTRVTTCDGQQLKALVQAGLAWLEQNYEAINRLNVYPVPDGDTGTNMLLTLRAACRAIADEYSESAGTVARKLAQGALYGSCGNSGTVLSQLFGGFAGSLGDAGAFDAPQLVAGWRAAVRAAYQTFQEPVEGTILTVAREIGEEIEAAAEETDDLREILSRAVERGKWAVARTPELLPMLKKAGVVDSGGQGLVVILEGMLGLANGGDPALIHIQPGGTPIPDASLDEAYRLSNEFSENGFGYDVQYIVQGTNLDVEAIRARINGLGRSAIVIGDSTLVKVHVHVQDPETLINYGRSLGELYEVKIEDMQAQSEEYWALRTGKAITSGIAVVAVAPGEGLAAVFRDLGASEIVVGGQTMNPSAGEMVGAALATGRETIILLPNNRNVILAANQAARIIAESAENGRQRNVLVLPTRSVPQGIAAMYNFRPDGDPESILAAMRDSVAQVVTGEITIATRDLNVDGLDIRTGQIIGLADGALVVAGDTLLDVTRRLLQRIVSDGHQIVTFYHGAQLGAAESEQIAAALHSELPGIEFTVIDGGQPLYPLIISVE